VLAATVPEALCTGLDDGDHVAFVHMRGEALLHVARMQHLDVAQCLGLPQAGLFTQHGFHGAPFNHQRSTKNNPMLSNMLSSTLRVHSTSTTATTAPSR